MEIGEVRLNEVKRLPVRVSVLLQKLDSWETNIT